MSNERQNMVHNDNKEGKLVFNSYVARQLLVRFNNQIIDLKKDRNRENATVFVFEKTDKLLKDLEAITNEIKEEREKRAAVKNEESK